MTPAKDGYTHSLAEVSDSVANLRLFHREHTVPCVTGGAKLEAGRVGTDSHRLQIGSGHPLAEHWMKEHLELEVSKVDYSPLALR